MQIWRAALAMTLAVTSLTGAQAQTSDEVHAAERARFGFGDVRRGADGNADSANPANADEAKVGSYTLPPLFAAPSQRSPAAWNERRVELARLVEDNWVGRIPEVVSQFQVVWRKETVASEAESMSEQWVGQVIAPDGRMGPTIDATITFPAGSRSVPALIDYSYIWPPGFNQAALAGNGPRAPDSVQTALRHGYAHVAYRPQLLQADNAAEMSKGVIGLARWPREKTDWGALRAWAWGASQLREELAADPRIDRNRISLQGHSRFGKGVLVAAAFDHAFADANVSSSGAGGAKLMRRDFGERWENMAGSGAFHWYTPNIMTYASGARTTADLPVDAHTLIALRAPRPLFVTSGVAEKGDAWVDPTGMWLATTAAQPAWGLYGEATPSVAMPAAGKDDAAGYRLGWFQHTEGHVPWPGYEAFYEHEARFAGREASLRYRDPWRPKRPRKAIV